MCRRARCCKSQKRSILPLLKAAVCCTLSTVVLLASQSTCESWALQKLAFLTDCKVTIVWLQVCCRWCFAVLQLKDGWHSRWDISAHRCDKSSSSCTARQSPLATFNLPGPAAKICTSQTAIPAIRQVQELVVKIQHHEIMVQAALCLLAWSGRQQNGSTLSLSILNGSIKQKWTLICCPRIARCLSHFLASFRCN